MNYQTKTKMLALKKQLESKSHTEIVEIIQTYYQLFPDEIDNFIKYLTGYESKNSELLSLQNQIMGID